jgi:hypothetical protein
MCEVRSREKRAGTKKKKKYNGQQQKEMDCHEPHPAPNEKTQPIQWTERPTGALVGANSLWPLYLSSHTPWYQELTGMKPSTGSLSPIYKDLAALLV